MINPGLTFLGEKILTNRCRKMINQRMTDAGFISIVEIGFVQGPQKLNDGTWKVIHSGMIERSFIEQ
jgi:hypothetical protein